MNITHIVSSLDSNQGGPPQVVFNLAESQSLEGHKVNILSQYKRINYKKKTKFKRFKIIRGSFLIKKHYIPDFDFIKKIYNNIKNAEIVHLHGVWNGVISLSSLISRLLNKKIIMTPHGSLDIYNVKNKYIFKKIYYHLFEKFNINYIHGFHFLNKNEYKNSRWIYNLTKKKILIQSNSIDTNYIKNLKIKKKLTNRKKIQITYLGRINKIKNISLQIELINFLKKRDTKYQLNIYGPDDGELTELKKKIIKFDLDKNIKFNNPVYGIKKYSILKNSDVVILTSFYECNSVLAIEVMSLGGVLLCTKNCNLSDAGKKGAVKISDYKLQNLVKSLDFLTVKKNAKIIRKKALKYAKKNLDINLNIKKILKFYRNINKLN